MLLLCNLPHFHTNAVKTCRVAAQPQHCNTIKFCIPKVCAWLAPWFYKTGAWCAGPSVVVDQAFDQEEGKAVPDTPVRSMVIYPETGLYCIFDGKLAHGVLESTSRQDRATLLVNWWTSQPEVLHTAAVCIVNADQPMHSWRCLAGSSHLWQAVGDKQCAVNHI